MTDIDLLELLHRALDEAHGASDARGSANRVHAHRSRRFVEGLAACFRDLFPPPRYAVFSKYCPDHRKSFKLNEFSYDVHVCELGQVGGKKLSFVKRALWQVESELAEDLREALIDFSKLVAGSAPQRLLVGPRVSDSKLGEWLDCLSAPARECSAATYAAFIPHPRKWSPDSGLEVDLYRFGGDEWHQVGR